MKKITFLIITTIFLFTPNIIVASEDDGGGIRQEIRTRVEAKIDDVKTSLVEREQERNENRLEVRNRIAEVHAKRLTFRFNIYYQRLSKMITKIEERFSKLEDEGKDLTDAKQKLNDAKVKLEEAKKYADESISTFESLIPNEHEGQSEVALSARDLAENARKLFMECLKLIKEAVKLAKEV